MTLTGTVFNCDIVNTNTTYTGGTGMTLTGTVFNCTVPIWNSSSSGTLKATTLLATADVVAYHTSDKRLKQHIIKIDNAMSKISQLSGVTFEWKNKKEHPSEFYNDREAGIIAQEVQKVLPEAVKEREDGYLAVKYEQLIPLLIEGMKEQQEQINRLEEELNKLKDNI
jgi:hypothetical protein